MLIVNILGCIQHYYARTANLRAWLASVHPTSGQQSGETSGGQEKLQYLVNVVVTITEKLSKTQADDNGPAVTKLRLIGIGYSH
jgi:hypothetical protein